MQKYKLLTLLVIVIFLIIGFSIIVRNKASKTIEKSYSVATTPDIKSMQLTSPVIRNGGNIPEIYTCDGKDINPPLEISNPPEGTKSLVLIVDDVDAPSGDFIHWTVWNIEPDTTSIAENSVPKNAVEGVNDFGKIAYGGPCPPTGTHHYYYRLYALDSMLNLDRGANKNELNGEILDHVLDHDDLMATYTKKQKPTP